MQLKENMTVIYGDKGREWFNNLHSLVQILSKKWNLRDLVPCDDLSYNYVMSGWRVDSPVILKIGIDLPAIQQESTAISAFNGHGSIRLIEADLELGAILISRAIPGKTLSTLFHDADDQALSIACRLAESLHKAVIPRNHTFPLLSDWFKVIDQDWDLPIHILQRARTLRDILFSKSTTNVLLHGDLHYANILSAGEDWIVIDPKGVIGDPLYDLTGCLLREPFKQMMQQPSVKDTLTHRMHYVAKYVNCEFAQIWSWTYIQSVMSVCWSLEDGQDISQKRIFLDILEQCYE